MLNSKISVISLTLMTIGAVDNIRNLPSIAVFGKQIPFFYLVASLFFFIPCALVSAQLSSTKGVQNGVYHWVKRAFGPRFGLTAVWLQWVENLVWYPTLLAFIAGTLGYWISPELSQRHDYLIITSILCFLLVSVMNLYGLKLSATFSSFCSILGLLVPMLVIILLGAHWYFYGKPISNILTATRFIPKIFDLNTWTALTSVVMSLCGVEITTAHVNRAINPQKNYPKALLTATFVILTTLILASLSIAIVVPSADLSFVSGIAQSLEIFLKEHDLLMLLKYFIFSAAIGSLGTLNNWLLAPIQGLHEAAKDGLLPKIFSSTNRHGIPVALHLAQTIVVILLICLFAYFPTINSAYWFMTVLASQLYMLMYIMMFISFIKLRNQPDFIFRIPGGNKVGFIVAVLGMIGCFVTILVGFIPFNNNWHIGSYAITVLCTLLFVTLLPNIFGIKIRKKIITDFQGVFY